MESPRSINEWALETFGDQNLFSIACKLEDEAGEVASAALRYAANPTPENKRKLELELADVDIVKVQMTERLHGHAAELRHWETITEKMMENRNDREWELNPDGTFSHKKEDSSE